MNETHKLTQPCAECPFSKKCGEGALGGSHPTVYVGQIHGPFWLPCHRHCDFKDPNWKSDLSVQQCAGAAIFRANLGLSERMPPFLHKLPPSDLVFSTVEEFYKHHNVQCSISPIDLMKQEIAKTRVF